MKRLALVALIALAPLAAEPDRLILHFDVNGTVMAGDTAGKRTPEETLIQKLGQEAYGIWDHSLKKPISYAEYVNRTSANPKIRKEKINSLFKVMKKQNHPKLKELEEAFKELKGAISEEVAFPSFYRLLTYLDHKGIPYTVHLRTFGKDIEVIKSDCIKKRGTPLFTKRLWVSDNTFVTENKKKLSIEEAYQTFCEENVAGQEDWRHWRALKKKKGSGKLFPIDTSDVRTLSIFFDDQIEPGDSPTNIVVPVDLKGNHLDIDSLIASGELCFVDTLEAIRDPDYFIKKVEAAIKIKCPG